MPLSFTRTLRLKVRAEACSWLNAAAVEMNEVFKCFRVFETGRLEGIKWQGGCFAQDALGDWWLCLPVKMEAEQTIAPQEAVGIDLGLKENAYRVREAGTETA